MTDAAREAALVEAARQGDEQAFEQLFALHEQTLRRYARQWLPAAVRRRVSASDVLQEAHIVALQRIADFENRNDNAFRNWLLKILELKVKENVYRHKKTKKRDVDRELTRSARPETGQFRSRVASPSQVAVASEMAENAARALQRLPPHYREVLTLVQEQHLTMREVGERIGKSREAAKKIYSRALARFSEAFEGLGGERA